MKNKADSREPWKPVTLRAPVLASFTGFSLTLIVILELLSFKVRQDGGISFADRNGSFTGITSFAYLYLPTILAVSYSMLWSWVDLDAKRLEPWFQMSRSEGASAEDSVLLHYPFEFVAFAPLRALRRGHWSVVFAGTAMVAIFWAITPLQSAVFTTLTIRRTIATAIGTTASLRPLSDQATGLTTGFMLATYETLWLGQELPGFTTMTGAILPFAFEKVQPSSLTNETLTATTNFYSTALTCEPAAIGNTSDGYPTFDNRRGCHTDPIEFLDDQSHFQALYIGYADDPNIDWSLSGLGCPVNTSHEYLAIWAKGPAEGDTSNITALFCKPSYFVQTVNATVTLPNMSVSSITPLGSPLPLTEEVFNISNFEYIIGTGALPLSSRADIAQTAIIEQWPRISHMRLGWPTTNMVGFGIGTNKLPSADYMDADILASSFESAHKVLFALAFNSLLTTNVSNPDRRTGVVKGTVEAVVIVRTLAILVEAFLGLVAALAAALLYFSWLRRSQLWYDPASIKQTMSVVTQTLSLLKSFSRSDATSDAALAAGLGQRRYRLRGGRCSPVLQNLPSVHNVVKAMKVSGDVVPSGEKTTRAVRPVELSLPVGTAMLTILFLVTTLLVVLQVMIIRLNGLPLPSNNAVVLQLILNYIPTAFATLLESFWVVLNRLLCMLQPFEEFRKGQADASVSFSVKYTSLPPQLVFWRALRARHIRLAAVCGIAVSANVLAVALSALFKTSVILLPLPQNITSLYLHQIKSTVPDVVANVSGPPITYSDHFYVAYSNISNATALPPWISPTSFFLPYGIESSPDSEKVQGYRAVTLGFEVDLDCTELSPGSGTTNTVPLNVTSILGPGPVAIPIPHSNGHLITCVGVGWVTWGIPGVSGNMKSAFEIFMPMEAPNSNASTEEKIFCSNTLVAGFVRADITVNLTGTSIESQVTVNTLSALWMSCQPRLLTAPFSVTVSPIGHVISSTPTASMSSTNISNYFAGVESPSSLYAMLNSLAAPMSGDPEIWHTDTFASSWLPYLMKSSTNSSATLDPLLPPPPFEPTARALADVYKRLAAIILGLNADTFFVPAPAGSSTEGAVVVARTRVFMSPIMFYISITLLTLHTLVAAWYYVRRPKKFLPQMPTTIASLTAMFPASHLLDEMVEGDRDGSGRTWESRGWRFAYGRYVGTDGKPHVGIARAPFVVPLKD